MTKRGKLDYFLDALGRQCSFKDVLGLESHGSSLLSRPGARYFRNTLKEDFWVLRARIKTQLVETVTIESPSILVTWPLLSPESNWPHVFTRLPLHISCPSCPGNSSYICKLILQRIELVFGAREFQSRALEARRGRRTPLRSYRDCKTTPGMIYFVSIEDVIGKLGRADISR